MDDLERCCEILGVKPGASLKEIRDAYRWLQEQHYPDYYSKSAQRQDKAREELREIYSAYKKLKLIYQGYQEEKESEQEPAGNDETPIAAPQAEMPGAAPTGGGGEISESAGEEDLPAGVWVEGIIAEKEEAARAAEEALGSVRAELQAAVEAKVLTEKTLSEAIAMADRERESFAAQKETAEKRAEEEVAAARIETERAVEEKNAAERILREERQEFQERMTRLAAEKESELKIAIEKLDSLKTALEKTALAERAAAQELASAKAEIAALRSEKATLESTLSESRAFAKKESERVAAEKFAATKEFAGELSALQAELNRTVSEKSSLEKALKQKFSKKVAGAASGSSAAMSLVPFPTKLLKGVGFGGMLVAVGILGYAVIPCRQATPPPSPEKTLTSPSHVPLSGVSGGVVEVTPVPTPSPSNPISPAMATSEPSSASPPENRGEPVSGEKDQSAAPINRTKVNSRQERGRVTESRGTNRHSGTGIRSAHRMRSSFSAKNEETALPEERSQTRSRARAGVRTYSSAGSSSHKPGSRNTGTTRNDGPRRWWQQLPAQGRDTDQDTEQVKTRKYKVDMYPFARY